jgi:hypothetical protein
MTWIGLGMLQNTEQYKLINHMSDSLFILSSLLLMLNKYGNTVFKIESVQCNFYQADTLCHKWPAQGVMGEVNW